MSATLGVIVNPIAGMGGRIGLKGTDGAATLAQAERLGAIPRAPQRALTALQGLAAVHPRLAVLTCAGSMGADEASAAGLAPRVLPYGRGERTSAEDTRAAAAAMAGAGVDLLLFAGGDGTARDVLAAVGARVPVLGVPAGVKLHSAVFATSPRAAGRLAGRFLAGMARVTQQAEVMDVDEQAYRAGVVSARLFGYLSVPDDRRLTQGPKTRAPGGAATLAGIAAATAERMTPGTLFVFGPGTTTRTILAALGLESTLLGVDVILDGRLVAADVAEAALLRLVAGRRTRIVVTPIGGQGYILGRGNQQISARVIAAVSPDNLIVVATPEKLAALRGRPLLVDTDDDAVDHGLSRYVRVVCGRHEEAVYPVKPG